MPPPAELRLRIAAYASAALSVVWFLAAPVSAAPTISSIDPVAVGVGSADFDLTVSGTGFVEGSTIIWGGVPVTTSLLSACACLIARVPSGLIPSSTGSVSITVRNPDNTVSAPVFIGITSLTFLTASRLAPGIVGQPYEATLVASGGAPPFRFAIYPDIGTGLPWATLDGATITGTPQAAGVYSFRVGVFDSSSLTNKDFTITVASAAISSLNPSSATAGGPGFTLTVAGSAFASGAAVAWNAAPLATTFVSATQLTAAAPASLIATPGTATITVVSGGVTSNSASFIITAGPAISSLSPSTATAGGPAFTLTVRGTAFASGAVVQWNGAPLTTTFVSATQLTAAAPASRIAAPGTATITVLSSGVTSNSANFTITAAPAVSSLSPSTATAGGPAFTLTVTGSGFASGAVVRWNGAPLATTFVSATQLTAAAPASLIATPGTATITVVSSGVTTNSANFTITAALAISSLSPSTATAGGPAFILTVAGAGFESGAIVQWNRIPLATTFVSSTQLSVTVSAGLIAAPGAVPITVVSGGVTSNSIGFTIVGAPAITSLSPSTVAAGGPAFTLTVSGAGFASGALVRWNVIPLAATFVSPTQLTVAVPAGLIATPGTATIVVVNPDQSTSRPVTLSFTRVAIPAIRITGLEPTDFPTQPMNVGVQLEAPATLALQGTLSLSFRPAAAGVGEGYRDPALQFAQGGTTLTFSVPAGVATVDLPQNGALQQGTVAGVITVTLTRLVGGTTDLLPQPSPSRTITVRGLAPVILPNSVRLLNVTPNGFEVELTAYSTPRDLTTGTFTFAAAAGAQIDGTAVFTVNLSDSLARWYASEEGRAYGSAFRLRVPFTLSGDPSGLQSVTVRISNSVGASGAEGGTRP